MDQGLSHISGKEPTDATDAMELERNSFTHCCYVGSMESVVSMMTPRLWAVGLGLISSWPIVILGTSRCGMFFDCKTMNSVLPYHLTLNHSEASAV